MLCFNLKTLDAFGGKYMVYYTCMKAVSTFLVKSCEDDTICMHSNILYLPVFYGEWNSKGGNHTVSFFRLGGDPASI